MRVPFPAANINALSYTLSILIRLSYRRRPVSSILKLIMPYYCGGKIIVYLGI